MKLINFILSNNNNKKIIFFSKDIYILILEGYKIS